jgi:hypothetical protein
VSLSVSFFVVAQIYDKKDRHDTDCIQARDRPYTNCVCTVGVPASYRRAKGAPPLKPECGSTNLSKENQNTNLIVRNYDLMFGSVGVIT